VPFVGLIMDYIFTYQKEQYAREQAEQFSTAAIIAKKEAEAATALAQSANMAKTDFLNMISHELRTPLTVVIGNLQEISDDNELTGMLPVKIDERRLDHHLNDNSSLKNILNNETERHSLKDIIIDIASVDTSEVVDIAGDAHRYANHLLILINDVLDFSKIQAGKMSIICEPIYAIEIVDHVFESISSLAKQKKLTLTKEIPDGLMVSAEAIRLKQILLNLMGNAVKFTAQGTISVHIYEENEQAIFSIVDSGSGIEQENLDQIFEPFNQIDSSPTREESGRGLGLAITKKLVELHHGKIWAESIKGRGSQFHFSIPLSKTN